MPIHQERMIALVDAANEHLAAISVIRAFAEEVLDAAESEQITWREALKRLCFEITSQQPSPDVIAVIAAERAHFKRFAHRNRRAAARMRTKKSEGTTSRGASPLVDQARVYTNEPTLFDYDLSQGALDAQVARARRAAGLDPSDDPSTRQDKQ